jgi:SagB-type dehydrogenase family enzyme
MAGHSSPKGENIMTTAVLDPVIDESIYLPLPVLSSPATLAQALANRRSSRAFRPDPLPLPLLSALLWSADGVNRKHSGERTAPSAHNWQEIEVYAVMREGAYRYDAPAHRLCRVKADDLRGATGEQDFVASAPLNLVYAADFARMREASADERSFLAGADAGCIAQNVYLFCAAAGLATVVRGLIDRARLALALGLSPTQRITLAQSVGYPLPA